MASTPFAQLNTFIDTATKSRKYAPNTASGFKAALKLYEGDLNEEELGSIQLVKDNIEQIHKAVFN